MFCCKIEYEGELTSGQMMVVMMDAGTTIPPIPRPAMVRMPQSLLRLSTLAQASAPQPVMYLELVLGRLGEGASSG